ELTSANRSSSINSSEAAAATICWARISSGASGICSSSRSLDRMAETSAPHLTSSSCVVAKMRPLSSSPHQSADWSIRCSGQAIVDLVPHLIAGHGAELAFGDLDREIHFAAMADLHDPRIVAQKARHQLDGLNGGGKADALKAPPGQRIEPGETQRQVRAAL